MEILSYFSMTAKSVLAADESTRIARGEQAAQTVGEGRRQGLAVGGGGRDWRRWDVTGTRVGGWKGGRAGEDCCPARRRRVLLECWAEVCFLTGAMTR
jgi:hypothetical protein